MPASPARPAVFFDVYCTVLGGRFVAGMLAENLGTSWAILDGYTKIHACCQDLHAAVEAALELRPAAALKGLHGIVAIDAATHELALPLQNAQPHNTLAVKFSMAHALATTLVTGAAGAAAFASFSIDDARVDALRRKVTMRPWPGPVPAPPNDRPAQVTLRFTDGTTMEATCLSARGGADRPFPDARRLEKIGALAAANYPRLGRIAAAMVALPATEMRRPWRDLVGEFTAPA